MNTSHFT